MVIYLKADLVNLQAWCVKLLEALEAGERRKGGHACGPNPKINGKGYTNGVSVKSHSQSWENCQQGTTPFKTSLPRIYIWVLSDCI